MPPLLHATLTGTLYLGPILERILGVRALTKNLNICARSGFSKSVKPLTALVAGARMLKDLEDTKQAFVIFDAIDGPQTEKNFQKFLNSAAGKALIEENVDLKSLLTDRRGLEKHPIGSLASSFIEFTDAEHLDPEYLLSSAQTAGIKCLGLDGPRNAFMASGFVIHDLIHVLTGYGRDPVGEACVLAFTAEQMNLKGIGLFSHALAIREQIAKPNVPVLKIVAEARRMGREAIWLPSLDFRKYFYRSLKDVRSSLDLISPELFHKHGFAQSVKETPITETTLSSAA